MDLLKNAIALSIPIIMGHGPVASCGSLPIIYSHPQYLVNRCL